ncbi:metal ABC transporter solute-binding protein, Zn/Mn family [Pelistega sp. MC2]|uniref:metal ABC transporter solute-binding protein, Zn/Mn family n=1 Tax=Pelistega sp. MC2 TaxID=1720297 RepID=UPI0008D95AFF|nr:zinc ABC transporter substrate-binding protein [Pelistega sp. MC2]
MKLFLALALGISVGTFAHAENIKVATSFSIIEDMVKNVGGDKVEVINLVGTDADMHQYEMRPEDIKRFASHGDIKAFFVNGLELDSWANNLAMAADFSGKLVAVSDGIKARKLQEEIIGEESKKEEHEHEHDDDHQHAKEHATHDHKDHDHEHEGHEHGHEGHHHHGNIDPHAWQSLENAVVYVDNIEKTLSEVDKANATFYAENAKAYKAKLTTLNEELKKAFAALPANHRYLVTSHEALGYFADAYGLTVLTPLGVASESEPSAKDIANVIKEIRAKNIPAVFLENVKNPKLLEQISRETGAKIGGTLYTDALAKSGEGSTYFGMMQSNAQKILEGLK